MPVTTTNHLKWLTPMGFDDTHFQPIHRSGDGGTIAAHMDLCAKTTGFKDNHNRRTRDRLAMLRSLITAWQKRKTGLDEPPVTLPKAFWQPMIDISVKSYP